MIYLSDINVHFGERALLHNISFVIGKKDRVGLIGRNGAGKSTLLRIMTGMATPDSGRIDFPKGFTFGFLKQDLFFDVDRTVLEEAKIAFDEINKLTQSIEALNTEIAERTDYESKSYLDTVERLSDLIARLELMDAGNLEAKCVRILSGLGFKQSELSKPVSQFSGGWKMRIELAKLLLTQPDLLLLDEPTNHLDIESIIWLEEYLIQYPGTVLVISHDKQFLNNVCNRILELELGRLFDFSGNYDFYVKEKAAQREILAASFANQQKLISSKEKTINRFMAKATKTKMAQSMQKQLDKLDRIELPDEDVRQVKLNFGEAARSGRVVYEVKNIGMAFGDKRVLGGIDLHIERGDKIAFVGQNGQGKTTMAKILVNQLAATDGEIIVGSNVFLSYYAQNQAELIDLHKTVLDVMDEKCPAESRPNIRNILGAFLFSGEDVDKKVSVLSGGERARLAIAAMILNPSNVIIMDEPTNHLDIQTKEILKSALLQFEGTLIVVSHDREFLEGLSNKVYEFVDGWVKEYLGDINFFLEKKKFQDIRDIDTQKKVSAEANTPSAASGPVPKIMDHEETKKLKRRLQYVERDIEKLEGLIADYELKATDSSFYGSKDFESLTQKYKDHKSQLETLMEEWDEIATSLA